MPIFGFFKGQRPDLRTLGKWLWNNDVALLAEVLQNTTLLLLTEIMESGVVTAACGTACSEPERGTIAAQLTHLLDGRSLVRVYDPVTSDAKMRSAAEAARQLVLSGEYPELCDISITLGTVLAILPLVRLGVW